MSPKSVAKWEQKPLGNALYMCFDSTVSGSASCQQKNISFLWMSIYKCQQFFAASNGFGQINKSAHCPEIRLPFLAARIIESKAIISPHPRCDFGQTIDLPVNVKNSRVKRSARSQNVLEIMSHLVQQREDVLITRLVSVDQNALFVRQKFAMNVRWEIADINDFQAK